MSEISQPDRDYLTSLFDERDHFSVGAWDKENHVAGNVNFDFNEMFEIIDSQLATTSRREDEDSYEIAFEPKDDFRLLILLKDQSAIIGEGMTPREFYRLMKAMTDRFEQPNSLYVCGGSISYSWLRTELAEEEAIMHMLKHDDGVRKDLGLPEYDHTQW